MTNQYKQENTSASNWKKNAGHVAPESELLCVLKYSIITATIKA